MPHARMIRPTVAGAVPVAVDESSIKDIPGAKVVQIKDFLAVVAEKEWNAVKAAKALKVTWSQSKPNFPGHDKLYDHIRKAPVVVRSSDPGNVGAPRQRDNGSVEDGFKQAARIIEGEYEYPTQSHASMGPACAVADVRDGGARFGPARRSPMTARGGIAELLDLPPEKVRAIWMFGTGGYARDDQGDATADAAVLSKHLKRPVRVQYMRHEGLAWDPKGTAVGQPHPRRARCVRQDHRLREHQQGVLDGRLQHQRAASAADTSPACARRAAEFGQPPSALPATVYTFDNARWGWEVFAPLMDRSSPLRTTHHPRSVRPADLFGSESFLDEVAAATNTDPIEFRLQYLKNDREHEVFAPPPSNMAGTQRPSPRNDQDGADIAVGRGFAYRRQLHGTYDRADRRGEGASRHRRDRVPRMVCAHDCGLIVNPETIKHVIDRQLVWHQPHDVRGSAVRREHGDQRRLAHLSGVEDGDALPKSIEVVMIDRPDEAAIGRRRNGARPAPGGDRQCGVRCDRRAAAARALYARAREDGAGEGVNPGGLTSKINVVVDSSGLPIVLQGIRTVDEFAPVLGRLLL